MVRRSGQRKGYAGRGVPALAGRLGLSSNAAYALRGIHSLGVTAQYQPMLRLANTPTSSRVQEYRRCLRTSLPADAFRPEPWRLVLLAAHWAVIAAGVVLVARIENGWAWLAVALVSGHSMACLGFLAHELSHNAIVRIPWMRHLLELLTWSVMLVPATVWRAVHNDTHHRGPNTPADPDRKPGRTEMSRLDRWYFALFFPHAGNLRFNPLIGIEFVPYILRVTLALLLASGRRLPTMPAALEPGSGARRRIVCELAFMLLLQGLALAALDGSLVKLAFAALLPVGFGSCVAMLYLFTNHSLRSHQTENDPLAASTSLAVPRWMDWLHSNFSYHTEHHLFPTLRSRYYPLLSKTLGQRYPQLYHRVSLMEAWRMLFAGPMYQPDHLLNLPPASRQLSS